MAEETLELFVKGSLGTCWYGKYHYLEPWAGCAHDCHYCYARFRSPVTGKLAEFKSPYNQPRPLYPKDELLKKIREGVVADKVKTVKLCRYTDFFNPRFVEEGLALAVLEELFRSPVERVIVTTKGVPNQALLDLMARHAERVSYNAAVRPPASIPLEPSLPSAAERLSAAAKMKEAGLLTTVHLDPIIAGVDDDPAVLRPLLDALKAQGLNRVMFSYLLLSDELAAHLQRHLQPADWNRILASFDPAELKQYLPRQEETTYFATRPEVKKASVAKIFAQLDELGFEYVLCSLKNTPGKERGEYEGEHLCDGTFYA
ncbi:MAG: hypothetical protein A2X36_09875 [Elusimicrobia bacterium GWA2_69_24]|nr:MAG: hypothetical protein A2X36_09875 [Elusimicrobia bacterium GWA2_69_24]HBL18922.1 hypothetical protein [Elusimicrobiota bacterium]